MKHYPLLNKTASDASWIISPTGVLTQDQFLYRVNRLATLLPDRRYVIDLCEDRLNFMTSFAAVLVRGQTLLLPSNRSRGAIAEIANEYPDSYFLTDGLETPEGMVTMDLRELDLGVGSSAEVPNIPAEHEAVVVFTSGSTGRAQPNLKTWSNLVNGSALAQSRFEIDASYSIVATVPPQHMYGLETSILLPIMAGARVHAGRPFFPEDVRQALLAMPDKRVLVTTPIHLRACVAAELEWPEVDMIISATAPLDLQLARQVEANFKTPVKEIYGCTEAGSMASRRMTHDVIWKLYDEFQLRLQGEQAVITAPHLDEDVNLGDVVEKIDDRRFRLLGRHADMLNIAGKRASLSDLNLRISAIPGVEDGVFLAPDEKEGGVSRLIALVVAPQLTEQEIIDSLARDLDPVFLPRPVYRVDALPRNETGKLPRSNLLQLLKQIGARP